MGHKFLTREPDDGVIVSILEWHKHESSFRVSKTRIPTDMNTLQGHRRIPVVCLSARLPSYWDTLMIPVTRVRL